MELKWIAGVLDDLVQSLDETSFEVTRAHLMDARAALMAEMKGLETQYRFRRAAKPAGAIVHIANN